MSVIYSQIPRNRVFLERLLVAKIVQKFFTFYGTRNFITIFYDSLSLLPYFEPD